MGGNVMNYGIISLLPALLVIVFALKTKRTFEALLLGTFSAYIIIEGPYFLISWVDTCFQVATDSDVQWVILVCGLFGSLVALLKASDSTAAFSGLLKKVCHSARTSLVMTWIMGIIIFIDDYLNIITLGTCMTPLTDRQSEPREALAYVIDSTGAPVCVLLPFSTWAVYYASIFFQQPEIASLGFKSATDTYIHVIPYTFYAIFTLIVVFLFSMKLLPKLGKMKTAYQRVANQKIENDLPPTLELFSPSPELTGDPHKLNPVPKDSSRKKGGVFDFLLAMVLVIGITIWTGEMMYGLICALLALLFIYIPRKIFTFEEFCDTFMDGFCSLIPTIAVVFAAFIMQRAANDIGMPAYVISTVQPFVNQNMFPVLAFIVVSILTFATGSNWGIPAVCTPIIIPLGSALGVNPILIMAAILSGGTFGSHACFYSDATLLTSTACGINNMDHALSQLPYALIGAGVSCIAFLICGFIM